MSEAGPLSFDAPLEVVNKGREVPSDHTIEIIDNKGKSLCQHARVEVVAHNKYFSNVSVAQFPPDMNPYVAAALLRKGARKIEEGVQNLENQHMDAEHGEIVILGGLEHIVAGIMPGAEHPTVVPDWTSPKALTTPLVSLYAGWDKSQMWSEAIETNRPHIKHGINTLLDSVKDKGVIIAGSGPSLQVEQLKGIDTKKWDIIACNDAYRALDGKAKYFMLCETEAKPEWWKNVDRKTTAILSINAHEDACKQDWNAKFWFAAYPPKPDVPANAEFAESMGVVHEQLNVTMSALNLAYRMGYKRIVFVGCDFAYTGGESHVGEPATWRHVIYSNANDVTGGLVLTDKVLALQARCHEAAVYFLIRGGIDVVNCSKGVMTGMPVKDLGEVLDG